jgi:diaminopimelate epimerase
MTEHVEGKYIHTGAPHLVVMGEDIESMDVAGRARPLRYSKKFLPEGINVNFVERKGEELLIRTYEKGVENETLSCGTGVTASVLAIAENETEKEQEVHVESKGGRLKVKFVRKGDRFSDIRLTGPAALTFKGVINLK